MNETEYYLEDIKLKNIETRQAALLHWNNHANTVFYSFSNNLLGLSTLLITITSGAVLLPKEMLNSVQKTILVFVWFLLLLALLAGYYQYRANRRFFNILIDNEANRIELWKKKYSKLDEYIAKENNVEKTPSGGNADALQVQIILNAMAITLIVVIGVIHFLY